jgi:hypothetical protein
VRRFILTGLVTTIVLFILNAIVYVAFLKDFFQNHPAVSPEFMHRLYRQDDQLIIWAILLSAIAVGFFVTTIVKWSGARTFGDGIKSAFVFSILFLTSVDFGLLGTTNNFTTAGAFADMFCSTITLTISGALAAWMLGRRNRVIA